MRRRRVRVVRPMRGPWGCVAWLALIALVPPALIGLVWIFIIFAGIVGWSVT